MSAVTREALIEAAARQVFERRAIDGRGRSQFWDELPEIGKRNYRRMVADSLDAVLPMLADDLDARAARCLETLYANDPARARGHGIQQAAALLRLFAEVQR